MPVLFTPRMRAALVTIENGGRSGCQQSVASRSRGSQPARVGDNFLAFRKSAAQVYVQQPWRRSA